MEKILTKGLRYIYRDSNMILQQRWYWEWSNSYTWEDVPCVVEAED